MRLVSVSVVGCAVGEGFAIALAIHSLDGFVSHWDLYQDLLSPSLFVQLIAFTVRLVDLSVRLIAPTVLDWIKIFSRPNAD